MAQKQDAERITVVRVEPMTAPYVKRIPNTLSSLQQEVGGHIQALYPFHDKAAIVCNEEGKLLNLERNRPLADSNGQIYDAVCGNFLVVGLGEEDFQSLTDKQIKTYLSLYETPQSFVNTAYGVIVVPTPPDEIRPLTPDKAETGETIRTPRGRFHVTDLTVEQMNEAGYGLHHYSEDGKYLVMSDGQDAYAVANPDPSPEPGSEMTPELGSL